MVVVFLLAGLLTIDTLWLAFLPAALYLGISPAALDEYRRAGKLTIVSLPACRRDGATRGGGTRRGRGLLSSAAPGYFWVGGAWFWESGRYAWHPGRWEAPRPGYHWVAHEWRPVGNTWHMTPGHWARG